MRHAAVLELVAVRDEAELFVERQLVGLGGEVELRFAAGAGVRPWRNASSWWRCPCRGRLADNDAADLDVLGQEQDAEGARRRRRRARQRRGCRSDRSCRTPLQPARAARRTNTSRRRAMSEIAEMRGDGDDKDQRLGHLALRRAHKAQSTDRRKSVLGSAHVPVDLRHLQGGDRPVVVPYDGADAGGGAVSRGLLPAAVAGRRS